MTGGVTVYAGGVEVTVADVIEAMRRVIDGYEDPYTVTTLMPPTAERDDVLRLLTRIRDERAEAEAAVETFLGDGAEAVAEESGS